MSAAGKANIVDQWLQIEATLAPDCAVIPALNCSTKSMRLDEGAVLARLRELYKELPPTLGKIPPQPRNFRFRATVLA